MGQPRHKEPADEAKWIKSAGLHTWLILDANAPEVHPEEYRKSGTLPEQAARLVQASRARLALAPHPRSVSNSRVGGDVAADPGRAGHRVLPALPRGVSHARPARRREAAAGARGLGWFGLLSPRGEPAPARPRGRTPPRRQAAFPAGRASQPSGCRALYGGRDRELRVREGGA